VLPRRVANHQVEPAGPAVWPGLTVPGEDFRELEVPVEEPVVVRELVDLVHSFREPRRFWIRGEGFQDPGGWRLRCTLLQRPHKRGGPGVCKQLLKGLVGVGLVACELFRTLPDGLDVASRVQQLEPAQDEVVRGGDVVGEGERPLAGALLPVALPHRGGVRLLVSFEFLEGVLRNAVGQQGRRGSQQGVAHPDAGVEEPERFPGFEGLQPERDLAELRCHVQHVDAIHAPADHVPQGVLHLGGRWLVLPGPCLRYPARDPARGGDQEAARAGGGVAHPQRQQPPLGLRGVPPCRGDRLVEQWIQCGVQQGADQCWWGVVGTGGLPFVAGHVGELERRAVNVDDRYQFQERLVHPAEFFGAEVPVVHRLGAVVAGGPPEVADRG